MLIRKPQSFLEPIFHLVHDPVHLLTFPDVPHNPDELVLVPFLHQTDMFHHGFDLKMVVQLAHVKTQLTEDVDQGYLFFGGAEV